MLNYRKTEEATKWLSTLLSEKLARNNTVLWLVSGGSSIDVALSSVKLVDKSLLKKLIVAQVDERYGEPGHEEDNWHQLVERGFPVHEFKQTESILHPDLSLKKTVGLYDQHLDKILKEAEIKIGLFGIGQDGHVGGIKPGVEDFEDKFLGRNLVTGYKAEVFERITITKQVISQLDYAVVFAGGEEKKSIVKSLSENVDAVSMPAQLLKFAKEVVVFSDADID